MPEWQPGDLVTGHVWIKTSGNETDQQSICMMRVVRISLMAVLQKDVPAVRLIGIMWPLDRS